MKQQAIKGFKVDFSDEPVTAFAGLILAERLANRHGFWKSLLEIRGQDTFIHRPRRRWRISRRSRGVRRGRVRK
jgi:hypothetical protein